MNSKNIFMIRIEMIDNISTLFISICKKNAVCVTDFMRQTIGYEGCKLNFKNQVVIENDSGSIDHEQKSAELEKQIEKLLTSLKLSETEREELLKIRCSTEIVLKETDIKLKSVEELKTKLQVSLEASEASRTQMGRSHQITKSLLVHAEADLETVNQQLKSVEESKTELQVSLEASEASRTQISRSNQITKSLLVHAEADLETVNHQLITVQSHLDRPTQDQSTEIHNDHLALSESSIKPSVNAVELFLDSFYNYYQTRHFYNNNRHTEFSSIQQDKFRDFIRKYHFCKLNSSMNDRLNNVGVHCLTSDISSYQQIVDSSKDMNTPRTLFSNFSLPHHFGFIELFFCQLRARNMCICGRIVDEFLTRNRAVAVTKNVIRILVTSSEETVDKIYEQLKTLSLILCSCCKDGQRCFNKFKTVVLSYMNDQTGSEIESSVAPSSKRKNSLGNTEYCPLLDKKKGYSKEEVIAHVTSHRNIERVRIEKVIPQLENDGWVMYGDTLIHSDSSLMDALNNNPNVSMNASLVDKFDPIYAEMKNFVKKPMRVPDFFEAAKDFPELLASNFVITLKKSYYDKLTKLMEDNIPDFIVFRFFGQAFISPKSPAMIVEFLFKLLNKQQNSDLVVTDKQRYIWNMQNFRQMNCSREKCGFPLSGQHIHDVKSKRSSMTVEIVLKCPICDKDTHMNTAESRIGSQGHNQLQLEYHLALMVSGNSVKGCSRLLNFMRINAKQLSYNPLGHFNKEFPRFTKTKIRESNLKALRTVISEDPRFPSKVDGSWCNKRNSRDSLFGWVLLMVKTLLEGYKCIAAVAMSRHCDICCKVGYVEHDHPCTKNFTGTAAQMEVEGLDRAWKYVENELKAVLVDEGLIPENERVMKVWEMDADSKSRNYAVDRGIETRLDANHLVKAIVTKIPAKQQCKREISNNIRRDVLVKIKQEPDDDLRNKAVHDMLDNTVMRYRNNQQYDNSDQLEKITILVTLLKKPDYSKIGDTKICESWNKVGHQDGGGSKFQTNPRYFIDRFSKTIIRLNEGHVYLVEELRKWFNLDKLSEDCIDNFRKMDEQRRYDVIRKNSIEHHRHQKMLRRQRVIEKNRFLPFYNNDIYSGYETNGVLLDSLVLTLPISVTDIEFIMIYGDVSDPGVKAQICNIEVVIYSSSLERSKRLQFYIYPSSAIHKDISKQTGLTRNPDDLLLDGEPCDVEHTATVIEKIHEFIVSNTSPLKEKIFLCFDPFSAFNKKLDEHVKTHEEFKGMVGLSWKVDLSDKDLSGRTKLPLKPGPDRTKYRTLSYIFCS